MGQREFKQFYEQSIGADEEEDVRLTQLAREQLPSYFEEALEADNEELYFDTFHDLENSQSVSKQFPPENFELLLRIIQDPRFLKTANGCFLFSIFERESEKLNPTQKTRLLLTLSQIYERFESCMPCFSISELVGEEYPPQIAFDFFRRFVNSPNHNTRLTVPHGFEHALKHRPDEALATQIWQALLQMQSDASEEVGGEVEESLMHLTNRGIEPPDMR